MQFYHKHYSSTQGVVIMARAFSLDLRQKVVDFILAGGTKRDAARIFGIGEDSVYRWMRLQKKGDLRAKKRIFLPKKVNVEILRAYVEKHPDHTLTEIGKALFLGPQTVWKWLKRMKITRKKKPHFMQKAAQSNVLNSKQN